MRFGRSPTELPAGPFPDGLGKTGRRVSARLFVVNLEAALSADDPLNWAQVLVLHDDSLDALGGDGDTEGEVVDNGPVRLPTSGTGRNL